VVPGADAPDAQRAHSLSAQDGRRRRYEQSARDLGRTSSSGDNVCGDDGAAHQLGTVTGDPTTGYEVTLRVPVALGS
jgi:hypothetical protein